MKIGVSHDALLTVIVQLNLDVFALRETREADLARIAELEARIAELDPEEDHAE